MRVGKVYVNMMSVFFYFSLKLRVKDIPCIPVENSKFPKTDEMRINIFRKKTVLFIFNYFCKIDKNAYVAFMASLRCIIITITIMTHN